MIFRLTEPSHIGLLAGSVRDLLSPGYENRTGEIRHQGRVLPAALCDPVPVEQPALAQQGERRPSRWAVVAEALRPTAILLLTMWMAGATRSAPRPALAVVLGVAAASALWVQRRLPLVTLAAALGGLVAVGTLTGFAGPDDPLIVLVLWASFGVGRYAPLPHQPWAAAGTLLFLSLNLLTGEEIELPAEIVFPVLFTAAPWLLGLSVQLAKGGEHRARRLAHEVMESQEDLLRRATEDERLRLARELHDVAAHSMSTVSLQAQVLRREAEAGAPPSPEGLRAIETSARQAMAELRRVVGVLRPSDGEAVLAPQPGIDDLSALVEECRRAGQPVETLTTGQPRPLPPGLSLAAYRVVQEALSNARQHGKNGPVEVGVTWHDRWLALRIANPVGRSRRSARKGHGVIGIGERAALYGGSFSAGPDDSGRWVVDVRLPIPVATHD